MQFSLTSALLLTCSAFAASYKSFTPLYGRIPTVDDALLHRRQSVPIANLTLAQREDIYQNICAAASSANASFALQQDVNNVTANSLAIQDSFQKVAAQLAFIDSENLDTRKYAPGWQTIALQWLNILWASRDTATATSVYIQEFYEIIMPFVVAETDIPTAISVLQIYMANDTTADLQTNAKATSDNFSNLQTSLEDFKLTFANFAANLTNEDNTNIAELTGDIQATQSEIDGLNNAIATLANELEITGIITGVISADLDVIDQNKAAQLGGGIALIVEGVEFKKDIDLLSSKKHELQTDEQQLTALQDEEKVIQQANTTMAAISDIAIPTMVTQMGAFVNIWNGVEADCQAGISWLKAAESGQNGPLKLPPMIFWSTLTNSPCIYEQLVVALNNYAFGIAGSGIPLPQAALTGFTAAKTTSKDQFRAKVQAIIQKAKSNSRQVVI